MTTAIRGFITRYDSGHIRIGILNFPRTIDDTALAVSAVGESEEEARLFAKSALERYLEDCNLQDQLPKPWRWHLIEKPPPTTSTPTLAC